MSWASSQHRSSRLGHVATDDEMAAASAEATAAGKELCKQYMTAYPKGCRFGDANCRHFHYHGAKQVEVSTSECSVHLVSR